MKYTSLTRLQGLAERFPIGAQVRLYEDKRPLGTVVAASERDSRPGQRWGSAYYRDPLSFTMGHAYIAVRVPEGDVTGYDPEAIEVERPTYPVGTRLRLTTASPYGTLKACDEVEVVGTAPNGRLQAKRVSRPSDPSIPTYTLTERMRDEAEEIVEAEPTITLTLAELDERLAEANLEGYRDGVRTSRKVSEATIAAAKADGIRIGRDRALTQAQRAIRGLQ